MMVFSKLLYIFILFIASGNGYLINMNMDSNINKLTSIKNNINNYIEKKKYVKDHKDEIRKSIYNPIKSVDYEKILINLGIIKKIYLSNDYDRAIIDTGYNKYVHYIKSEDDKRKFNVILSVIPNSCKKIVICDKKIMTDSFGYLYCE
jgi:hypothetical protein